LAESVGGLIALQILYITFLYSHVLPFWCIIIIFVLSLFRTGAWNPGLPGTRLPTISKPKSYIWAAAVPRITRRSV